jgi:hypothetical protein
MAIDKLSNNVKLAALLSLITYLIIFTSPLYTFLPAGRGADDLSVKSLLPRSSCIAVLGGSNVRLGISADSIAWEGCPVINYGVNSEGGSFEVYFQSLVSYLSFDHAIYSPIEFWGEEISVGLVELPLISRVLAPGISILTQLKALVMRAPGRGRTEFTLTGDQSDYSCLKRFPTKVIDMEIFFKSHEKVVAEISRRLMRIGGLKHHATVSVRIPPIYVRRQDLDRYRAAIDVRKHMLQAAGWTVLNTTTVSSDPSLFCDSGHPNARGRDFFSQELKAHLLQIRRVQ